MNRWRTLVTSGTFVLLAVPSARAQGQPLPGTRPPTATTAAGAITTADFAWLAGTWEGRMAKAPGVAEVTFGKPNAGLITGVMRLTDQGKVLVVELISIVDTPEGPELRFRHFSATLEAYEPQFKQAMRLITHQEDRDTFENLVPFDRTLMSTRPRVTSFIRRGTDEFVGHSDTVDDSGHPGVVEVTYHRVR